MVVICPLVLRLMLLRLKNATSFLYSYFEKGCRKKCTRQSWKVLWVALRALFFKEIWKNGTRGHWHMFASIKGKQQKKIRQLQSLRTVYWSYPILPFRNVAYAFLLKTFLETVYWLTSQYLCKVWFTLVKRSLSIFITLWHQCTSLYKFLFNLYKIP